MSPPPSDPARIGLGRALISRRLLDRRITSAAILAGILLGAIVGALAGSFIAGVILGWAVGFELPGPVAYLLDRRGALPASARWKRLSLRG